MKTIISLCVFLCLFVSQHLLAAQPLQVTPITDGVWLVHDGAAQWSGLSMGMTHQRDPGYQARKTLDLSAVPSATWAGVREVRLSAFFCVRDYSDHDLHKSNGLDEAIEVVVNGKVHTYPTRFGMPVMVAGKVSSLNWFEFAMAKEEFVRGRNEVIFRKAPTPNKKPDDYLYVGIDNTVEAGNSAASFDGGKTWSTESLNTIKSKGEYMMRLYLISRESRFEYTWKPNGASLLQPPVLYAAARDAAIEGSVAVLHDDIGARIECDSQQLDATASITAAVETDGVSKFALQWLGADGKSMQTVKGTGPNFEAKLMGKQTSGVCVTAAGGPVRLRSLTLRGVRGYREIEQPVNICPAISSPAGKPANRVATCRVAGTEAILENATLRGRFEIRDGKRLRFASLFNELAKAEAIRQPNSVDLFLIEVGTNRFSGTRDFECRSLKQAGGNGFSAELSLPEPPLKALLKGSISSEGMRLALDLVNTGAAPVDFKLAFPHVGGLGLSPDVASDYYHAPRGGGIISDRPATIRQGYGDHQALFQVMDLFSPALGAGLSLRIDDATGRYKIFALRKTIPGKPAGPQLLPLMPTKPEFCWSNTLDAIPGTSMAVEYLRRTRGAGGSFSPAPAVFSAHAGDWHQAMSAYADWAHRAWQFRPPSRLKDTVNMIAVGWGKDVLFKDGQYRTDFIKPRRDCLELMSWWDWQSNGPCRTPIDQVREKLGEATWKMWQSYFVKDPVTGQMMFGNQPGDYDGYNERFGGLPVFKKAVEDYKHSGALITLYTDPIRCDDSTKMGERRGREWGVIGKDGKYVRSYDVWNMCHDVAEYREWVAATMERVVRETGADGIRLDEYGHRGWACFNSQHEHTFAEPGCTEWQREIAETCKLVRAAMDRVDRRTVLTTEHPGYDFLMQYIDGCITYDLTVQATPLRPLECNTQRFYFPECKAYELDHQHADPDFHKRFWNMVAAFGAVYPTTMYAVLKQNADVLHGRESAPLVPTLQPLVYANRFGSGEKTLWTLYNATGHSIEAPILFIELNEGQHLVDLLSGGELNARSDIWLPRNGVTCVARLPRLITLAKQEASWYVELQRVPPSGRLQVCNKDGAELLEVPVTSSTLRIETKDLTDKQPRCLKLLQNGVLLDVVSVR